MIVHHQRPLFRDLVGYRRGEDLLTAMMAIGALVTQMGGIVSSQNLDENQIPLGQREKHEQRCIDDVRRDELSGSDKRAWR